MTAIRTPLVPRSMPSTSGSWLMVLGLEAASGLDAVRFRLLQGSRFVTDVFPGQVEIWAAKMAIGSRVAVEASTVEGRHFSQLELLDDGSRTKVKVLLYKVCELSIGHLA
mmetsp:Transcript_17312/g.41234  ORF Transcript_17312/g.41234 Transcript_17312/m.41234 type:complete len:110 (-) Transcript_17312:599-928(-)